MRLNEFLCRKFILRSYLFLTRIGENEGVFTTRHTTYRNLYKLNNPNTNDRPEYDKTVFYLVIFG